MRKSVSRLIAAVTAAATILGTVAVQPAAAAPRQAQVGTPGLTDVSAQRRHHHRRGGNNAAVLGAVGLVFGTIAGIAAAEQRRRAYESYGYYAPGYAPYGYAPPPVYYGHPGWHYR